MDLMECYLSASRMALQANCKNPSTWEGMYTLLENLYENLSCNVCYKLLDQRDSYINRKVCTGCVNNQLTELSSLMLECFKKMCTYIQNSPLYDVMRTRDEDGELVKIITEVIGVYHCPTNGLNGLVNDTLKNVQQIEVVDVINEVNMPSSDVQLPVKNKRACINSNIQNKTARYENTKNKKNQRHGGCRCGNTTPNPGKLTCFGQRCSCYTEQKSCENCKCRGCRNPKKKICDVDDNSGIDKVHHKPEPVTVDLISSRLKDDEVHTYHQNYDQNKVGANRNSEH